MSSLRVQLISEARKLVEEMTALCLEYQNLLREPLFFTTPDSGNLSGRLDLADKCNDQFRTRPAVIARRLQVAGYTEAAESLLEYAAVVRRFSLLTVSWDPNADIVLLEHDVTSASDSLLRLLEKGRRTTETDELSRKNLSDDELSLFIAASDLIGDLGQCSDDYMFYFEGLQDAHELEEDVPNDVRMNDITAAYNKLPVRAVVDRSTASGLEELGSAIERLSAAVSGIVHLPAGAYPSPESESPASPGPDDIPATGPAINVIEVSRGVKQLYEAAIEILLKCASFGDERTD